MSQPKIDKTQLSGVLELTGGTMTGPLDVPSLSVSGSSALDASDIGVSIAPYVQHNFTANSAPTVNDDSNAGYQEGSVWIDTSTSPRESYRCVDATNGAAVWVNSSLEIGELGTLSNQDANNVNITGGSIDVPTLSVSGNGIEGAIGRGSDYGSIAVFDYNNGWAGYSIDGDVTLMYNGDGSTGQMGIYDDFNNQWMFRANIGGQSRLYHNGAEKLNTRSDGIDVTGTIYQNGAAVGGGVPSGTRMVFYQASAPTGWTQITNVSDRVLRVVSGSGGGSGGSWTISGLTTDTHSHTFSTPSHKHELNTSGASNTIGIVENNQWPHGFSGINRNMNRTGQGAEPDQQTALSGNTIYNDVGGTTDGSFSNVNSNGGWRPSYINVIVAEKD